MSIYQKFTLTEITDENNNFPLSESALSYFRERQRNRLYDTIIECFLEKEKSGTLTRAELSRKLNKRPEQITRWLSSPSNWTIDTVSDLVLAICSAELNFNINKLSEISKRNSSEYYFLEGEIKTGADQDSYYLPINVKENEHINA